MEAQMAIRNKSKKSKKKLSAEMLAKASGGVDFFSQKGIERIGEYFDPYKEKINLINDIENGWWKKK